MFLNQLTRYTEAMDDIMNYITTALYSTTYVEPPPTANRPIHYYQLFEELKSILWIIFICIRFFFPNKLISFETDKTEYYFYDIITSPNFSFR